MRAFNDDIRNLLRAPNLKVNLLVAFYLDSGTYRFCDDHINVTDGEYTWIGASALAESVEVKSGKDLAAEPVTLMLDGNRMAQYGVADPARVLRDILGYLYQQRRVDFLYGFRYAAEPNINLRIPAYAGKINYCRLIDPSIDPFNDGTGEPQQPKLEILLDALASRYGRTTFRLRTQSDQHEIDPNDDFFSFVGDIERGEQSLYWGKKNPSGTYRQGGGLVMGALQYMKINPSDIGSQS